MDLKCIIIDSLYYYLNLCYNYYYICLLDTIIQKKINKYYSRWKIYNYTNNTNNNVANNIKFSNNTNNTNNNKLNIPSLLLSTTSQTSNNDLNIVATVQSTPPAPKNIINNNNNNTNTTNKTLSNISNSWSEEQRILGNWLCSIIKPHTKNFGKIVGCLLTKYSLTELKKLINQPNKLLSTVSKCDELLNNMGNK